MLLSGHQPVYLPGIILFNKIAMSDAFMFVGHCQNVPHSWHTRNKIRVGDRPHTLSVPVIRKNRFGQSINEAQLANVHWRRKHLRTMEYSYRKRPFFDAYYPKLAELLMKDWRSLGEMDMTIIRTIMEWLEIKTPVYDSENYCVEGAKTDMVISMCQALDAESFLFNEGSRVYLEEERLASHGIQAYWQVFEHPTYDQGRDFIENLSIVDLLFNVGEESCEIVRSCGRVEIGPSRPGSRYTPNRQRTKPTACTLCPSTR
jgi:hypothetical protein